VNKKTFMATRSRKTIAHILLCLVLGSVIGFCFVDFVNANFTPAPLTPLSDKPAISLISPINGTSQETELSVTFIVGMPKSWDWIIPTEQRGSNINLPYSYLEGTITSVTCILDQTQIIHDDNRYGAYVSPNMTNYGLKNLTYTQDVGILSLGEHTLTISVNAFTTYLNYAVDGWRSDYDVSTNETFTFIVSVPSTPTSSLTPTPSPSINPTLSPTPTLEPTQTATPSNDYNQTLDLMPIIALCGVVVVAVALGVLVYFKKRKRS
jgi:hypothetical protein